MSDSEELVNMWDMLADKTDEWDTFRYNNLYKLGLSCAKSKLSHLDQVCRHNTYIFRDDPIRVLPNTDNDPVSEDLSKGILPNI